jgi:hypothetical protein
VIKVKAVPLYTKQVRGDVRVMFVETHCILLISENLLQSTSTYIEKYLFRFNEHIIKCDFLLVM